MFRASRRCTEVNSRASTDSGTLRKVSYLNTLHSWRVYVTALKLLVKLMGRVQSFSCCSGISWVVVLKNSSRLQEAGLLLVHGRAGWCREVHVHICRGRHVSTKNMKLEEFLICNIAQPGMPPYACFFPSSVTTAVREPRGQANTRDVRISAVQKSDIRSCSAFDLNIMGHVLMSPRNYKNIW